MATTVQEPVVGQVVYRAYRPTTVGRVVEVVRRRGEPGVRGTPLLFAIVRVRWNRLEDEVLDTRCLRDYAALVEEEEGVARRHRGVLDTLRAEIKAEKAPA